MRKLLLGLAILAVVVGLALVERYDYVTQGGQALRVDRLTGRIAVLRKSAGGGIDWTNVATSKDIRDKETPHPPIASSSPEVLFDCPDQGPYSASGRPELFKPQCDQNGNRVSTFR